MNIPDETVAAIEEKLDLLSKLDPADLPEPAAELAELLSDLLDEAEAT